MSKAWPDISYLGSWYFLLGIYTSILTWTRNSFKTVEAPSLNISSHGKSLKITKNVPISKTTVISYAIKWDIPLRIWWKVNGNWDITWSEVPNEGKVIVEQILVSEERKNQKSRTMMITVWDLFLFYLCNYFCLKKLHLRCCIGFELNILTWSTKVLKGIGGKPYDLE